MAQVSYGTITISDLTDGASIWTTTTAPTTPNYTFTISNLQGSESIPKVGDVILYDIYRYTITRVDSSTVLAGYRQSLQGTEGRGVESIETKFTNWTTNTESNAPSISDTWYDEPPAFNSQRPYYYVWVRTIYTDHLNPTDEIYLDNSVSYALNKTTEIDALKAQAKYFWWDEDGAHIASGLTSSDSDNNIQQLQPASYGFNALTAPGFLKLRYEDIDYAQLTTNGLTFYNGIHVLNITSAPTNSTGTATNGFAYTQRMSVSTIKTQSGSNEVSIGDALRYLHKVNNNYVVDYFYVGYTNSSNAYLTQISNIQGKKAVELSTNALTFYKPLAYNSSSEPTAAATLNANGLVLSEGGIKSGNVSAGDSGFVYLSTKNYSDSPTITINDNNSNWRAIIGTKFGVDEDGNLYASGGKFGTSNSYIEIASRMNGSTPEYYLNIQVSQLNFLLGNIYGQNNIVDLTSIITKQIDFIEMWNGYSIWQYENPSDNNTYTVREYNNIYYYDANEYAEASGQESGVSEDWETIPSISGLLQIENEGLEQSLKYTRDSYYNNQRLLVNSSEDIDGQASIEIDPLYISFKVIDFNDSPLELSINTINSYEKLSSGSTIEEGTIYYKKIIDGGEEFFHPIELTAGTFNEDLNDDSDDVYIVNDKKVSLDISKNNNIIYSINEDHDYNLYTTKAFQVQDMGLFYYKNGLAIGVL